MRVGVVLLVALLFLGACAAQQQETGQKIQRYDVSVDDDPSMGSADAKITIIAFEDYECPFCGKFNAETLPALKEKYIDTGMARFVVRDLPLVSKHPDALEAALAAGCAEEQGKYWDYHDILFKNQDALKRDDLIHYAKILLLDEEKFTSCLDNKRRLGEIQKDMADAKALGVSGTPTFFVDGYKLEGAHPITSFDTVISQLQEEP